MPDWMPLTYVSCLQLIIEVLYCKCSKPGPDPTQHLRLCVHGRPEANSDFTIASTSVVIKSVTPFTCTAQT